MAASALGTSLARGSGRLLLQRSRQPLQQASSSSSSALGRRHLLVTAAGGGSVQQRQQQQQRRRAAPCAAVVVAAATSSPRAWLLPASGQRRARSAAVVAAAAAEEGGADAAAGTVELEVTVEGMKCGGCSSRVEKALQAMSGVTAARVDLEAKLATVEVAAPSLLDAANMLPAVVAAINELGFKAEPHIDF